MSCHIIPLRLASQDRDDRGVDRNGSDYLISINSTSPSGPVEFYMEKGNRLETSNENRIFDRMACCIVKIPESCASARELDCSRV